ncbi:MULTISPECIES: amidohydrolase family protein [unclassified Paracoccus (in: a-proteobacteria)]|uniref:amidohydrolase family protein n=1 Tax=unclassified Paracoccus (in: a-proteobacteria) TaxID=2688777 RepID=UPI0012B40017|nr:MULTISPECIES: amidohydrolase family protein [unclassified Paracoccus (in: a-proteobacteria)]UXU76602.1 amidohydrolase family protein [Paracoccus sp. SMMA_5]UXU82489.1 amidohydrolase family protein [Paracoccus sp. SMMA_5_TC]
MIQSSSNTRRRAVLIRGGQLARPDGTLAATDVLIGADGRIARLGASLSEPEGASVVDASGCLVTPGFVDMHQHLDKTGVLRFTPNPSGTLQGARDAFALYARKAPPEDVLRRAARTLGRCLAHGTTAIRSHVNVDKDAGFNGIDALAQLRAEWADLVQLQLVAFMTPHPGQDLDWLRANIDRAVDMADVVGGTPAVAEDPDAYMDILFETAARHGLPVDLHLDEHLDADRQLFPKVFERVRRFGLQGRTVLSHCSVLSAMPREEFLPIMDQILELDLGVVTLPAANLYLQGRDRDMLPPRGLTRVAEMLRAGVRLATASDNIQDPFVPTGSGDMLEIARWTLLAGHLKGDELPLVHRMIGEIPAGLMGLGSHALVPGARADLLVARADDVANLVAGGAEELRVFAAGRLVSETTLSQDPGAEQLG